MVTTGADVTIAIPTIPGRQDLLRRAVAAVSAQSMQPAALLIYRDEERRGAAYSRNRLLERVRTEWVCWCDDDDSLLPNHVEELVAAQNKSGADLVYSYAEFIGISDPLAVIRSDGTVGSPFGQPFGPEQEQWFRERGNFIPITHMARVSLLRVIGGMPEPGSFTTSSISGDCEDYGALVAMLDAGAMFHHVPQITWQYYHHGQNTAGKGTHAD